MTQYLIFLDISKTMYIEDENSKTDEIDTQNYAKNLTSNISGM